MNQDEAKKIIENCFENSYNEENFKNFIINIFKNNLEIKNQNFQGVYIKNAFSEHVKSYKRLFKYQSPDIYQDKIDILAVNLKNSQTIQKSRTLQRNFIASYLEQREKDAVLVAFYSDENLADWKFSYITRKLIDSDNKIKSQYTSPRRMTFLVGKHEKSHTAKKQFLPILQESKTINLPILEQAFSTEIVTDEFYEKYKELFHRLTEALQDLSNRDPKINNDFANKEIAISDFAKKTLGQIAFLYFLQKKGWFGVLKNQAWGTGDKNFLQKIFEHKKSTENFFNDILEPLFYSALAVDRGNLAMYEKLNCRMPFLNGGLFEPLNGYLWESTNINLPDHLFSNTNKTKDSDIGDGIFDIFNRYNFTVCENEPLEKEVAVDPEMLGKVFENLLEIKDRKSKGAFYTPREIVHYMCQETLINFLDNQLNHTISKEDLEFYIKKGDEIIENDKMVIANGKETETYKFKLPATIYQHAQKIDQLLCDIKVCDPAVGSGAFMLGMLNEIVKARSVLQHHLTQPLEIYSLKLHAIANSIYGVDLDSGAVEITKLRLWLALVVEEQEPRPLPNLDHKIMQGNSLLEEYEGIKLFDENILQNFDNKKNQILTIENRLKELNLQIIDQGKKSIQKSKNLEFIKLSQEQQKLQRSLEKLQTKNSSEILLNTLFDDQQQSQYLASLTAELQQKISQFIFENQRSKKENLKKEIDNLKYQLIEETLKQQNKTEKLAEIKKLRQKNIRQFFIWRLEFCDVFCGDNPGFDVVIGNPPYIGENKEVFKMLKNSQYYMGKANIWYFFGCVGLDLLKKDGIQAYIAPNNWTSNFGAKLLRKKTLEESKILEFIDFEDYKVFENADIQTMIYIIQKCIPNNQYKVKHSKLLNKNISKIELELFLQLPYGANDSRFTKEILNFEKQKFLNKSIQFLKQETNFIINKISSGNKSFLTYDEVAQGIVIPQDLIIKNHLSLVDNKIKKGDGIFVLSNKEKEDLNLNKNEIELLKPYFMTPNFYKYGTKPNNDSWIIYTDSKFKNPKEIEKYPNLKKHLDKFRQVITSDNKPYGLHRARDESFFKGEKIVVARKCLSPSFSYNNFDCYVSATFYVIKTNRVDMRYLTAFLNSKIVTFWLKNKGKMQGNNFQIDKEPLLEVPIKIISIQAQQPFIALVDEILSITNHPDYNPDLANHPLMQRQKQLEAKIDEMVCDLYQLDDEEKNFILNN